MVKLHQIGEYKSHFLRAKKDMEGFPIDSLKECAIQVMSDKRYAVMAVYFRDYFYHVINTQEELHESFDELTREEFALANG